MSKVTVSQALTREHHEIDSGLESFVKDLERGVVDAAPVLRTIAALRRHIYLEEQFVFPPVRQAGVLMPVLVMLREHGAIWQLMDTLVDLLADPDVPDRARAIDDLISTCRELLSRLDEHNAKEEPIIYPHADSDLTDEASLALSTFLRTGTTPDGWVCEAAR